jgi:hypothetical protein
MDVLKPTGGTAEQRKGAVNVPHLAAEHTQVVHRYNL